jgi:hypothetical protein
VNTASEVNAEMLSAKLGDVNGQRILTSIYYLDSKRVEIWTSIPDGETADGLGRTYHSASVFIRELAQENLRA